MPLSLPATRLFVLPTVPSEVGPVATLPAKEDSLLPRAKPVPAPKVWYWCCSQQPRFIVSSHVNMIVVCSGPRLRLGILFRVESNDSNKARLLHCSGPPSSLMPCAWCMYWLGPFSNLSRGAHLPSLPCSNDHLRCWCVFNAVVSPDPMRMYTLPELEVDRALDATINTHILQQARTCTRFPLCGFPHVGVHLKEHPL